MTPMDWLPSCSGELIAGYINNEVLPVPALVMEGLHPSRFFANNLIRSHK